MKEILKDYFKSKAYETVDCGAAEIIENDDYPDYALAVASRVAANTDNARGILVCGSGAGMTAAANKVKKIRAFLAMNNDQVFCARHDDDMNVMVLASDHVSSEGALNMAKIFMETPFGEDEKYRRRVEKINQMENA